MLLRKKKIIFLTLSLSPPPQGDGIKFVIGQVYTQPNALPGARVLREGGNGLILEVNSRHVQLNYLYQLF